jgi:hypothetical protein
MGTNSKVGFIRRTWDIEESLWQRFKQAVDRENHSSGMGLPRVYFVRKLLWDFVHKSEIG